MCRGFTHHRRVVLREGHGEGVRALGGHYISAHGARARGGTVSGQKKRRNDYNHSAGSSIGSG